MKHLYGSSNTKLQLSKLAKLVYNSTDPLTIEEIETKNGLRYKLTGCVEPDTLLTGRDVNAFLESMAYDPHDPCFAHISVDNGVHFTTPEKALKKVSWEAITAMMDPELVEKVNHEMAPCTELEFLKRYLMLATENLIIG